MEYLLFGFPLRMNTLVQGISQLPPATILRYDLGTGQFEKGEICKWRFDHSSPETRAELMSRLKQTLLDIMQDRIRQTASAN